MEEGRLFTTELERLPPHIPSLPKFHSIFVIPPPQHMFPRKKLF
jgi:hypothetical protein